MPLFVAFSRMSRGRNYTLMGQPCPLTFRDIRDAAERCICELTADQVEVILTNLDDLFLELAKPND